MHSAKARDAMVARVNAAHAEYKEFNNLPEIIPARGDKLTKVRGGSQNDWIAALYEACQFGQPYGRIETSIVARFVDDEDDI